MASEEFGYLGPQNWVFSGLLRWTRRGFGEKDDQVPLFSVFFAASFFALAYAGIKFPVVLNHFTGSG